MRGPQWLSCLEFLCFAGVAGLIAAGSAGAGDRDLTRVVYDYAVTSYCGTLDLEVERGFRDELAAETRRSGLDAEGARKQRIKGWVAAENEWSNRGLGGFRAWCRDEGVSASGHFRAIARGEKEP